jgi:hypothetical protein
MQVGTWRSWSGKVCNKLITSVRKNMAVVVVGGGANIISSERIPVDEAGRKYSIHVSLEMNKDFKLPRGNKYLLTPFPAFNIL